MIHRLKSWPQYFGDEVAVKGQTELAHVRAVGGPYAVIMYDRWSDERCDYEVIVRTVQLSDLTFRRRGRFTANGWRPTEENPVEKGAGP